MPSKYKSKDRLTANNGDCQHSISSIIAIHEYLTPEEELEIDQRFKSSAWKADKQVLWSGMLRQDAQAWADEHEMQTLTTAMGLLLLPDSSKRPGTKTPHLGWSRYIHGASAIFARHIADGNKVTVLSPPPPQRFHPSGLSYFQTIELPILIAAIAKGATLRIEVVHPGVKGASNCHYQLWPVDEANRWAAIFHAAPYREIRWRKVKTKGQERGVSVEQVLSQIREERDQGTSARSKTPVTEAIDCQPPRTVDSRSASMENTKSIQACSKPQFKKTKKKKRKKGVNTAGAGATVEESATTKRDVHENKGDVSRPLNIQFSTTQHQPSNNLVSELSEGPIASRTRSKTRAARESRAHLYLALRGREI